VPSVYHRTNAWCRDAPHGCRYIMGWCDGVDAPVITLLRLAEHCCSCAQQSPRRGHEYAPHASAKHAWHAWLLCAHHDPHHEVMIPGSMAWMTSSSLPTHPKSPYEHEREQHATVYLVHMATWASACSAVLMHAWPRDVSLSSSWHRDGMTGATDT
jgi:hypothetical protein